jgi:hypothetical protein
MINKRGLLFFVLFLVSVSCVYAADGIGIFGSKCNKFDDCNHSLGLVCGYDKYCRLGGGEPCDSDFECYNFEIENHVCYEKQCVSVSYDDIIPIISKIPIFQCVIDDHCSSKNCNKNSYNCINIINKGLSYSKELYAPCKDNNDCNKNKGLVCDQKAYNCRLGGGQTCFYDLDDPNDPNGYVSTGSLDFLKVNNYGCLNDYNCLKIKDLSPNIGKCVHNSNKKGYNGWISFNDYKKGNCKKDIECANDKCIKENDANLGSCQILIIMGSPDFSDTSYTNSSDDDNCGDSLPKCPDNYKCENDECIKYEPKKIGDSCNGAHVDCDVNYKNSGMRCVDLDGINSDFDNICYNIKDIDTIKVKFGGQICTSNLGCAFNEEGGLFCNKNGVCLSLSGDNIECDSDFECSIDGSRWCVEGKCIDNGLCKSNKDCDIVAGYICDLPYELSKEGYCKKAAGEFCASEYALSCVGDMSCGNGQKCVNNKCVECKNDKCDSLCITGYTCVKGKCVNQAYLEDKCYKNSECADGKICSNSKCVKQEKQDDILLSFAKTVGDFFNNAIEGLKNIGDYLKGQSVVILNTTNITRLSSATLKYGGESCIKDSECTSGLNCQPACPYPYTGYDLSDKKCVVVKFDKLNDPDPCYNECNLDSQCGNGKICDSSIKPWKCISKDKISSVKCGRDYCDITQECVGMANGSYKCIVKSCETDRDCNVTGVVCDIREKKCVLSAKKCGRNYCNSGEECVKGVAGDVCVAKITSLSGCKSDSDCNNKLEYCYGGRCLAKLSKNEDCGRNTVCLSDLCIGGKCVEKCDGTRDCLVDEICTSEKYCKAKSCDSDSDCDRKDNECNDEGICAPEKCKKNSDCLGGQVCDINSGETYGECVLKGKKRSGGSSNDCEDDLEGELCDSNQVCYWLDKSTNKTTEVIFSDNTGSLYCCAPTDVDSSKYKSNEGYAMCAKEQVDPLSGNSKMLVEGACVDPDGDGLGTRIDKLCDKGGISNCKDLSAKPCKVTNVISDAPLSFYGLVSFFVTLGLLVGYYLFRRK